MEDDILKLIAVNKNFQPKLINRNNIVAIYKVNAVIKNIINHFID